MDGTIPKICRPSKKGSFLWRFVSYEGQSEALLSRITSVMANKLPLLKYRASKSPPSINSAAFRVLGYRADQGTAVSHVHARKSATERAFRRPRVLGLSHSV